MRIQCPECDQRFDVAQDFLGKTVECGSCDGSFKVTTDDVVTQKKKFYPGEKVDSNLGSFGKNVHEGGADVAFAKAQYQQDINPAQIGPLRPRRTLAILAGVSLMILVIVVFLFGGGKEGSLRDMDTAKRFVLCGFSALLGGVLVLYGMPHNRRLGLLLTVAFAVILLVIPVFLPGNPISASDVSVVITGDTGRDDFANSKRVEDNYMLEIGYEPVGDAIVRYPKDSVVGIFLRNAGELVSRKIARYLYDATDKVSRETVFKRGDTGNHGLILLVEQKMSIDEIAALCMRFGRVEKIDKDLRLIDVVVESSKIATLDKHKMLDPESLDYEVQNLKALKSFDPKEQMDAVRRLATAKPRALRDEISLQLIQMLPVSKSDLQLEIINALKVWALPESGAAPVVLEAVRKLHQEGKVSKTAMEFLVLHKVDGCEIILMELWEKDPLGWSDIMIQLAGGAELLLLPKVKEMDAAHVAAASDILGKAGTKSCIEFLEGLMADMDGQKKKSLQAAIDEIKKRS